MDDAYTRSKTEEADWRGALHCAQIDNDRLRNKLAEAINDGEAFRKEAATFRRLLESKQEELAREQKLREDREKAHNIERIQWRESLREKDEETQRWRRKYEAKEWK